MYTACKSETMDAIGNLLVKKRWPEKAENTELMENTAVSDFLS